MDKSIKQLQKSQILNQQDFRWETDHQYGAWARAWWGSLYTDLVRATLNGSTSHYSWISLSSTHILVVFLNGTVELIGPTYIGEMVHQLVFQLSRKTIAISICPITYFRSTSFRIVAYLRLVAGGWNIDLPYAIAYTVRLWWSIRRRLETVNIDTLNSVMVFSCVGRN